MRHAMKYMFVPATALATAVVVLSGPSPTAGVEAGQAGGAAKKPDPVVVTNDATKSVPVSVQGTPTVAISGEPTVNISGTPTVNANVSGSVGITGTPTVSVTGLTAIQDLTDGTKEAFSMNAFPSILAGEFNDLEIASPPVPPGKRFVIEHVTVQMNVGSGAIASISVAGAASGNTWFHTLVLRSLNPFASQTVKFYSDGGWDVSCSITRSPNTENASGHCMFSGYLVNRP